MQVKKLEQFHYDLVDKIVNRFGNSQSSLIPVLQEVQDKYRYLPEPLLLYIAKKLDIEETTVYGVATFYENFSFEEKGKYVIKICDGTACHVRKSIPILEYLHKELKLNKSKHTTDDRLFTVETVSCLGACGLAPVLTVNDHVYPAMTQDKAKMLLEKLRGENS